MKTFWQYFLYIAATTLWIALIAVAPDFFDNPITNITGAFTLIAYVIAISVVSFLFLYIAAINKYLAAIFIPIYGLLGAAVSYYRVMYRVTITPLILDCILHTNIEEAAGVITWSLVLWILFNISVGVGFVVWRWKIKAP